MAFADLFNSTILTISYLFLITLNQDIETQDLSEFIKKSVGLVFDWLPLALINNI